MYSLQYRQNHSHWKKCIQKCVGPQMLQSVHLQQYTAVCQRKEQETLGVFGCQEVQPWKINLISDHHSRVQLPFPHRKWSLFHISREWDTFTRRKGASCSQSVNLRGYHLIVCLATRRWSNMVPSLGLTAAMSRRDPNLSGRSPWTTTCKNNTLSMGKMRGESITSLLWRWHCTQNWRDWAQGLKCLIFNNFSGTIAIMDAIMPINHICKQKYILCPKGN